MTGTTPPNTNPDRFTTRQLIEEAQREVEMRRRTYRKLVRAGRMDPKEADTRIDMMTAIARRLTKTAAMFGVALGAVYLAHIGLETALALDGIAAAALEGAAR